MEVFLIVNYVILIIIIFLNLKYRKKLNKLKVTNEQLKIQIKEKQEEISKDPMTGVKNKKVIMDHIEYLLLHKIKFCILLLDIDNFKSINDNLGHYQGDICIKKLAHISKYLIKSTDFVGRYGGDEFVIIVTDANDKTIESIANRLLDKIRQDTIFTISIGIYTNELNDTVENIIEKADKALYKAKNLGRDRVEFYK